MIEKARQDLETNRQIIRQIRVDDRSIPRGERDVIRLRNATEDERIFRRMLTSADRDKKSPSHPRWSPLWGSAWCKTAQNAPSHCVLPWYPGLYPSTNSLKEGRTLCTVQTIGKHITLLLLIQTY